jgi:hypothetical protein
LERQSKERVEEGNLDSDEKMNEVE